MSFYKKLLLSALFAAPFAIYGASGPSPMSFPTITPTPQPKTTAPVTAPPTITPAPTLPIKPRKVFNPELNPPIQTPVQQFTNQDAQNILDTVQNQLSMINAGQYERAYQDYTSAALRARTSQELFNYYVEHYSVIGHNKSALFGNPEFYPRYALLKGTMTSTDGKTFRAEFRLVKEGNQWKVNGLQLFPVTSGSSQDVPKPVQAGANYDFQKDIEHVKK